MGAESPDKESINLKRRITPWLKKCPQCGKGILLWVPSIPGFECLNADCGQEYTESEFNSIRYRVLRNVVLFLVLAIVGAGIMGFALSNLNELDRPVVTGLSVAALIAVIWNVSMARRFWRYRMQHPGLLLTLAAAIFIGLIAFFTAATYVGIAPFATDGDSIAEHNANGMIPDQSPTPTPSPQSETGGDVGLTRQDGSLRVTIDGICSGPRNNVKVEMTIANTGASELIHTRIQTVPKADLLNNPLAEPTHVCYEGIAPGQKCFYRTSDGTHVEYEIDNHNTETYIIVRGEDLNGSAFGLTVKLPPLDAFPKCT
ncbi:MAG: hypothetical protein JSV02_00015 [Dehalococcoidia bacterium]|nr:MAG: hypothetical protein JSV02_00015 [Dehalococcoidia bacterium]